MTEDMLNDTLVQMTARVETLEETLFDALLAVKAGNYETAVLLLEEAL